MMLSRATYLVSVGNNINSRASPVASPTILRALLPMTSKADKLPMDMELVACDNNRIFTLKLGDQTFVPPYSTDNRSIIVCHGLSWCQTIILQNTCILYVLYLYISGKWYWPDSWVKSWIAVVILLQTVLSIVNSP